MGFWACYKGGMDAVEHQGGPANRANKKRDDIMTMNDTQTSIAQWRGIELVMEYFPHNGIVVLKDDQGNKEKYVGYSKDDAVREFVRTYHPTGF